VAIKPRSKRDRDPQKNFFDSSASIPLNGDGHRARATRLANDLLFPRKQRQKPAP
jgi:hypothetical protein